jgi:cytoskeletal protein CcmA (bactofilin family)
MMKKNHDSQTSGSGIMNTIIGKDTTITGTLDVKGAVRVDGSVKGKIICSDCVTVGATGAVEADIQANTAIIAGHLMGNVQTSEKVELQSKCELDGDIKTKSRVIEQGAVSCGSVHMKGGTPDLGFLKDGKPRDEQARTDSKAGSK